MNNPDQSKLKQRLTDAERQERFAETAKKVGASENIADFDKAFDAVVTRRAPSRKVTPPEGDESENV